MTKRLSLTQAGCCHMVPTWMSDLLTGEPSRYTLCLKKKHVTTFLAITGTMNVRL